MCGCNDLEGQAVLYELWLLPVDLGLVINVTRSFPFGTYALTALYVPTPRLFLMAAAAILLDSRHDRVRAHLQMVVGS